MDYYTANLDVKQLLSKDQLVKKTISTKYPNGTNITEKTLYSDNEIESLNSLIKEQNAANQHLLTTLMAAISAWIGGIIAFYFSKEYMVKALESSNNAITALAAGHKPKKGGKFKDLINESPSNQNVLSVDISKEDDLVEKIDSRLEKFENLFLCSTQKDDKIVQPWGMLYKNDWKEGMNSLKQKLKDDEKSLDEKKKELEEQNKKIEDEKNGKNRSDIIKQLTELHDEINEEIKKLSQDIEQQKEKLSNLDTIMSNVVDSITQKSWNEEPTGFDNFVSCEPNDLVKAKLKALKDRFPEKFIGKTKAIVFDTEKTRLLGIFSPDDLENYLERQDENE